MGGWKRAGVRIERRRDAARGAAHRADDVDGRRRRARGLQRWFAERGGVGFGIGRGTADRGIAAAIVIVKPSSLSVKPRFTLVAPSAATLAKVVL